MRAITADPRMPAYCTVFRWVKVAPEFGDAYRAVRLTLGRILREERDQARDVRRIAAGKRVGHWVAGRASSYTPELAEAVCEALRQGASTSEVTATPGMPSSKVLYTWLRRRPDFRAMFIEACDWRAGWNSRSSWSPRGRRPSRWRPPSGRSPRSRAGSGG